MSSGSILLVEDDSKLRKLYEDLLTVHGYTVLSAENGWDALDYLWTYRPNVLILDIMMPGLNGIETCREARKIIGDDVPILFLTALDSIESIRAGMEAGGDDYLVKKESLKVFLDRVDHWARLGKSHRRLERRARTVAALNGAEVTKRFS